MGLCPDTGLPTASAGLSGGRRPRGTFLIPTAAWTYGHGPPVDWPVIHDWCLGSKQ